MYRTVKGTGEEKKFYRLCESYRSLSGTRHHTIVHLGELLSLPELSQKRQLAKRIESLVRAYKLGYQDMFIQIDEITEPLAQHFLQKIIELV